MRDQIGIPASDAQLEAYLTRIGFDGPVRADLATLRRLHRRHVMAIAYENLDVQLGTPVSLAPEAAFAKIVGRRRGGWCYEMNGLFGWMLKTIGFRVTRLTGGVMREKLGDAAVGNHLVLLVELDRPFIADVGLGFGLVEPILLEDTAVDQGFLRFRLERLADGWWRFHNHAAAMPPSFDFNTQLADEALLRERCLWLQSDPASLFVVNAIVQRHFDDRIESLVGRRHSVTAAGGGTSREIGTQAEYAALLRDRFGLAIADVGPIWSRTEAAGEVVELSLA